MKTKYALLGLMLIIGLILVTLKYIGNRTHAPSTIGVTNENSTKPIAESLQSDDQPEDETAADSEPPKPPVAHLTNSLYPLTPYDVYAENIRNAIDGDVQSQYMVYRVFAECTVAPRSEEELHEAELALSDDPEFVAELRFRFDRCKQFVASPEELDNEKKHWYTEAFRSGHPMVVARHQVFFGEDRTAAKEALFAALATGEYESYDYAAVFVGKRMTNQPFENAPEYSDAWLSAACRQDIGCDSTAYDYQAVLATSPWSYLGCRKNPGCDETQYEIDNLSNVFDQPTIDRIKSRSEELELLISQGKLDELGI